jgi:hypothetical protein
LATDLQKLDELLQGIGWSREAMERATGISITEDMEPAEKLVIWHMIRAPETLREGARSVLASVRPFFPEAAITAVDLSYSTPPQQPNG